MQILTPQLKDINTSSPIFYLLTCSLGVALFLICGELGKDQLLKVLKSGEMSLNKLATIQEQEADAMCQCTSFITLCYGYSSETDVSLIHGYWIYINDLQILGWCVININAHFKIIFTTIKI